MKRRHETRLPLLALREQVHLVNWWESDLGYDFGRIFMADKIRKGVADHKQNLADTENMKLDRARTYFVTSEMQSLVEVAARTMPEQPLELSDLPAPYGFVWFEDTVEQLDANGRPISWRALAWMPAATVSIPGTDVQDRTGIHLSYYTDLLDHADHEFDSYVYDGIPLEHVNVQVWLNEGNPRLLLLHENGWIFGQSYTGSPDFPELDSQLDPVTRQHIVDDAEFWTRRFVAALWTIMGQKITSLTPQHIPKTDLRPAQASLKVQPEVIYVDLRKVVRPKSKQDPDHEPQEVLWNHRWIVDGHWRNQYLPSTGSHRLQWIHPFVKGPDDRPLIVKDRVHRVRR